MSPQKSYQEIENFREDDQKLIFNLTEEKNTGERERERETDRQTETDSETDRVSLALKEKTNQI